MQPHSALFAVAVAMCAVLAGCGPADNQADQGRSQEAAATSPAPAPAGPPPQAAVPPAEAKLLSAWTQHVDAFHNAANDIGQTAVADSWQKDICKILPSENFNNWSGVLQVIAKDDQSAQSGVNVSITIGQDPSTFSNSIEIDNGRRALIQPGTALYGKLSSIKEGAPVRFSGSFSKDESGCFPMLTTGVDLQKYNAIPINEAELKWPLLIVRFTDIEPIG
jgi:hypothetical protein